MIKINNELINKILTETCADLNDRDREHITTLIDENLPKWNAFFERHENLFEWTVPDGSCMAFPRYKGPEGVEKFTRSLVEESGVLLLPSTIYASQLGVTPNDRFRLGFGRADLDEGLSAFEAHLNRNYS